MIKLYDSQIAQILPDYLSSNAEVQAMSYAISQAIKKLIDYCSNIGVYAVVDTLPEYALDMLAVELDTQYYDTSFSVEVKRDIIKNTLVWYLKAGTPSAVAELIAAVFGEGEVQEWFEYGDQPYFFKIETNATMTPEIDAQFGKMLERVKNARSHIRAIEIHRTIEQPYFSGACALSEYRPPAIIDGYEVDREAEGTIHAGVADISVTRPAAILDGFDVEGEIINRAHSGTAMSAVGANPAIMEELSYTADDLTETHHSGAAQTAHQKSPAIIDGFSEIAETVTQDSTAGMAADSRYKNIIE